MLSERIDKGTLILHVGSNCGAVALDKIEELNRALYANDDDEGYSESEIEIYGRMLGRKVGEVPPLEIERNGKYSIKIRAKTKDQCKILDKILELSDLIQFSDTAEIDIPCNGREGLYLTKVVPCSSGEYIGE